MLILSNEEIGGLLDMPSVIQALQAAYQGLAEGTALTSPTLQSVIGFGDHVYSFRQSAGALKHSVQALRINSDIVTWQLVEGKRRQHKIPASNQRFVGLLYLFEVATGKPLAILPDGILQQYRVGGTNGLAARYLASDRANLAVALLGSGWQAQAQLLAVDYVLKPHAVRVYSPNSAHREAFCAEMQGKVFATLTPVSTPDAAVGDDAAVVIAATSSIEPVLDPAWIRPGRYFSTIDPHEANAEFVAQMDRVFLHSKEHTQAVVRSIGTSARPLDAGWWTDPPRPISGDLVDLISEQVPGRASAEETLLFVNNVGLGIQFAAVGGLLLERARSQGQGHQLPDEWFTQVEPS